MFIISFFFSFCWISSPIDNLSNESFHHYFLIMPCACTNTKKTCQNPKCDCDICQDCGKCTHPECPCSDCPKVNTKQ